MKSFSYLFLFILLISLPVLAQDGYERTVIPVDTTFEKGGYGAVAGGYDFDGDGKKEIYAVNTNTVDRPEELIPRIYKFEFNGTSWDSVWGATLNIPLQNTWPAFAVGDLDGDGKMELIWGPVNNTDPTENPNPPRVVVFEAPGNGEEYMGVDDGTGTGNYLPNSEYTILNEDNANMRPVRFVVSDIDNDGHDELIFADRAAGSATAYQMHYGVLSVDKIPDDGDGSETWTIEASGKGDTVFSGTGNKWDVAVISNYLYLFDNNGAIYPVKYESNTWTALPAPQLADSSVSFRASFTVDINDDGFKEIVYGGWYGGGVYLLQQDGDSLVGSKIADLSKLGIPRINGGAYGDVNNDGKVDFVFGSRNGATPNNAIGCVMYNGGDITDSNSYSTMLLDSLYYQSGHDMDVIAVANLDNDNTDEVIYTSGYPRGVSDDAAADMVILNFTGDVSVKPITDNVPTKYYLSQNFPNPFNPVTTIRFGIRSEAPVTLKIYDILGREVAILINHTRMKAGEYDVEFDASALASGTYIYKLTAGSVSVSKKMSLLK